MGKGWGWGSAVKGQRDIAGVVHPSPTPSLKGRGFICGEGRGLVSVSGDLQFFEDCQQHTVGILQDVVVPEPDHAVAMRFDHPRSRFVGRTVSMLPAIEFNREPRQTAGELDHVVPNRQLPRKFHAAQLAGAQVRPQAAFGVGHVAAQFACDAGQSLSYQGRTPIPNPFPRGKGLSLAKPA